MSDTTSGKSDRKMKTKKIETFSYQETEMVSIKQKQGVRIILREMITSYHLIFFNIYTELSNLSVICYHFSVLYDVVI